MKVKLQFLSMHLKRVIFGEIIAKQIVSREKFGHSPLNSESDFRMNITGMRECGRVSDKLKVFKPVGKHFRSLLDGFDWQGDSCLMVLTAWFL